MRRILTLSFILLWLVSCGTQFELTAETAMESYIENNRSFNLEDKGISGFVNMNRLSGDTEIVNIYLAGNSIEKINVSEYQDLGRLDVTNNNIRFFSDLILPEQIRHIKLWGNSLDSLAGIEILSELKTLDISNNNLDDADIKLLEDLPNLKLIIANGNPNISHDTLNRIEEFSAPYLRSIKQ